MKINYEWQKEDKGQKWNMASNPQHDTITEKMKKKAKRIKWQMTKCIQINDKMKNEKNYVYKIETNDKLLKTTSKTQT